MNRQETEQLVRRLEEFSRRYPRVLLARTLGLIGLAYLYLVLVQVFLLFLMLLLLVVSLRLPGLIKFTLPGLMASGSMLMATVRSVWIRLQPPEGIPVSRKEAPKLYALLDDLAASLDCPMVNQVVFSGDLNAAVSQIPRLGILGWYRSWLVIGLPLMECLSVEEFRATMAHEFAHVSRRDGRLSNWVYRVRATWGGVCHRVLQRKSRWNAPVVWFVEWFLPRFDVHADLLSRRTEYRADASAARVAGNRAMAHTLVRLELAGRLLSVRTWPGIMARVNQEPTPPEAVHTELAAVLHSDYPGEAAIWLTEALRVNTSPGDRHPCLRERLESLGFAGCGVSPSRLGLPAPGSFPAASTLLGESRDSISACLSVEWRDAAREHWKERHEAVARTEKELAELEADSGGPPDAATLWKRIVALLDLRGDAAAAPVAEQLLMLVPDHAGARFVLGRHLLARGEVRGVDLVDAAMKTDSRLVSEGCRLLHDHFVRAGDAERAAEMIDRFSAARTSERLAEEERLEIRPGDTFVPHGLSDECLRQVIEMAASEPELRELLVARKEVRHRPAQKYYVLVVRIGTPWWKLRANNADAKLLDRLVQRCPFDGWVHACVLRDDTKRLAKRIRAIPGAGVYDRRKASSRGKC